MILDRETDEKIESHCCNWQKERRKIDECVEDIADSMDFSMKNACLVNSSLVDPGASGSVR